MYLGSAKIYRYLNFDQIEGLVVSNEEESRVLAEV